MARKFWWFNRHGKIASISNPGSATPNYSLTYDLAGAPYEDQDEFDSLAIALQAYMAAQAPSGAASLVGQDLSGSAATTDKTLWDNATDAMGFVGDQISGAVGAAQVGVYKLDQHMPEWSQLSETKSGETQALLDDMNDWSDYQDLGKAKLGKAMKELSEAPGAEQVFWGLEKLNEYSSTLFVAASLSEDDMGLIFKSGTWGDAHELTKERHLNAGEAFTQMFYDKEVLLDEDRFEQIRQHNTVFNVAGLAFNVMAAWKADPNVIFGQGLGKARDSVAGKLATSGRTREVQREVLSAPSMDAAKTQAGSYSGLADRLRAVHAVSLYDRANQLRLAAQEMGFEQFKSLPAFRNSASGTTMAKLMQDVADNDADWNLVFRSAIGDPDAVGELIAKQGGISDKIAAIELKTMPRLEADLERMEARYAKRLADQGRPQDARIEITRFGDKWLDDEVTSLRAESQALNAHLATYADHESWLQRALPGLDEDSGLLGRNTPNSIGGNLKRLGGQGVIHRHLPAIGGKVKMWQHDDYSPVSWALRAPTKPFLKRVGVVSLNDVDEGASAITGYLDQLDYIRGGKSQPYRDKILSRFAGATTDMERKALVQRLERDAVKEIGRKHGLSDDLMEKLGKELQDKRGKTWGKFTDTSMYSPIRGRRGQELEYVDDAGSLTRVKMPLDPTQLSNWHPLTNLTDLDRTIRENLDTLRSLDRDVATRTQAGVAWTRRHASEFSIEIGERFNSFWKPMALLSIRWPMRVVADESMRVMLLVGVLPHLAQWRNAAGYALYNTGVVRPFEWWNGRRIKTGSLSEESLRGGLRNDFDPYDYRAITNPTAVAPVDALDFGKIDKKRYGALNTAASERWQHLRSLEADQFKATTAPAEVPTWVRQWDERLAAAESSTERGFFFDPLHPGKGVNKGFAVSVYPGRMRTFPRKPTARELNYWTEKNSDLLAIPNNRAAVWLDRDSGRWHLDVVKTTKRREDAMLVASRAEATEFYDIEDGFTRYLSEDFWGHFSSPFVKGQEPNPPAGAFTTDFDGVSDAAGAEIGAAFDIGGRPTRKAVGFGEQKWRSRDGRVVKGERVFGPDTRNANIYHGVVSSNDAIRNLYGGYTKGIGADRAARQASDYRVFDPTDPEANLDEWATAWAHYVNNHIRYSPIGQRMLEGQSDDEIYEWLMATAKGREVRKRMGVRGENPAKWVSDSREIFEHMFTTDRALEAARLGEIDPKQVLDLLPKGLRPEVHGDTIKMGLGTSAKLKKIGKVVDGLMTYLGSMPTDALVRHPFAQTIYNREMRNYLSSVPAEKVTNNVLAAAEASARAEAVRQVRRVLYNIADEREGVHMLRFVSPFFQAQVEVLERYARISMEKPETVARLAQLLQGSQVLNTGLWQVTDRDGKPAKKYSQDNQVIFQVTPTLRGLVNKIPMLQGALDNAGDITIPVASLNLVLQGEKPYLPSMGPLVVYPASEFYFNDRPQLEGSAIYSWLYPFGVPKGDNFIDRGLNATLPAWARRAMTGSMTDFDDSAFARRVSEIGAQQLMAWEDSGREGPRPTPEDAVEAAKNEYRLRAASSFFMPAPVTPRSPYQFWIDQYRQYKEKYGLDADEKFYDEYGPTYYMFAQQSTRAAGGMGPNAGEKRAYDRYKSLAQRAPDMIGVLTGPFATDEFSDAVYQWQLSTSVSPTSSTKLRERLDPAERIKDAEISRGWVEYGKLASALDSEIRNRVAAGGSAYLTASANADLAAIKSAKVREIMERNPAWQDAYNSRQEGLGDWLRQAYDVSFDSKLDGRTDIEALRAYLISRAKLQDALRQREDSGQSSSDQLSYDPLGRPVGDNADLAYAWQDYVNQLKGSNLLFGEIYTRYLEGDDLSTYISPGVSGG